MKITLISPFPDLWSIGVRTLSSCLKHEGYQVDLLFLCRDFWKKYSSSELNRMAELCKTSDLIGISVFTNFFDNSIQITEQLKKTTRAPIVWGGIHPTIRPGESLQFADIACRGEAEDSFIELVKKIEQGQDYHKVKGMWFNDRGNIIQNPMANLRMNLDSIPSPDYDYENHYILAKEKLEKMDLQLTEKHLGTQYVTMATRGCPFGCSYCCNNMLHKMNREHRFVRKRSPGNIIQELVEAKKRLPFIQSVRFQDDAFIFFHENEIQELSDKFKTEVKLGLCVRGIHPAACNQKKLSLLVDAGMCSLRIGIQSASERTKALYKRNVSNEKMLAAVNMIEEYRDRIKEVQYDIILDNPWETDDDLIETLMFLVKINPPYFLALYSLTFYPDTELYYKAKEEGLIKDDLNDVYRKYYFGTRKTYLNNLFHLINKYAIKGRRLSPVVMSLLTSRTCRHLGFSYVLYILLFTERKVSRFFELSFKALKALSKGDVKRAIKWLYNKLGVVS